MNIAAAAECDGVERLVRGRPMLLLLLLLYSLVARGANPPS